MQPRHWRWTFQRRQWAPAPAGRMTELETTAIEVATRGVAVLAPEPKAAPLARVVDCWLRTDPAFGPALCRDCPAKCPVWPPRGLTAALPEPFARQPAMRRLENWKRSVQSKPHAPAACSKLSS